MKNNIPSPINSPSTEDYSNELEWKEGKYAVGCPNCDPNHIIKEAENNFDKEFFSNVILIILILVFICVIGYVVYIYDSDAISCLQDPVSYYENLVNYTCQCRELQPFYKGFSNASGYYIR